MHILLICAKDEINLNTFLLRDAFALILDRNLHKDCSVDTGPYIFFYIKNEYLFSLL